VRRTVQDGRVDELDIVTSASLGQFVRRWYGLPDRPPVDLTLPVDLPAPLADWYRIAARRSVPLSRDHAFYPPEGLDERDGVTVFWEDHQRTEAWGYPAGRPDPPVYERTDGQSWLPTGISLTRFLVYIAVYEAVYAPIHGLVRLAAKPDELDAVLGQLRPLDDPLWEWPTPGLRYYGDEDLLAHGGIDGAGAGHIVVAARHRDALGRFDGYPVDWDWDSRAAG
jgi:hypothetical protein